jgi:glutathione S-transferase
MSEVVLFGFGAASYPWTVMWACAEKGVPYRLEPADLKSPEYREQRQPYVKMPAMQHGDLKLFESSAIARYIDAAFDGPALQPSDPAALAKMEQWISVIKSYVYADVVPGLILQYLIPKGAEGNVDRAAVEASVPKIRYHLATLEKGIDATPYVVGNTLSLADIFVGPLVHYLEYTPEFANYLGDHPKLSRFIDAMRSREAFKATMPPARNFAEAA